MSFDPQDVPRDAFITSPEAWLGACRGELLPWEYWNENDVYAADPEVPQHRLEDLDRLSTNLSGPGPTHANAIDALTSRTWLGLPETVISY